MQSTSLYIVLACFDVFIPGCFFGTQSSLRKKTIERINQNLIELKEAYRQDADFLSSFEQYCNIQTLDRDILNQLVYHIAFHDKQHIEIYLCFTDQFDHLCKMVDVLQNEVEVLSNRTVFRYQDFY